MRSSSPAVITGEVDEQIRPVVTIEVVGMHGHSSSVEAILDTGFDGDIAMSRDAIHDLKLKLTGIRQMELPTGEVVDLLSFSGIMSYDGEQREITALQIKTDDNLLGMSLLRERTLTIEAWTGGRVVVE